MVPQRDHLLACGRKQFHRRELDLSPVSAALNMSPSKIVILVAAQTVSCPHARSAALSKPLGKPGGGSQ
jgi:hypothetical protein